jgi:preprotein translocase subunit SecE
VSQLRSSGSPRAGQASDGGRPSVALFLRQVIAELRKVVWPTREQLVTYFIVVLVFVLAMIAIVSVLDFVFGIVVFQIFG